MNTKQISQAVGKDERSVQRWITKVVGESYLELARRRFAGDKMAVMDGILSSIRAKRKSSTSTYPADYTLEETLLIIETGMGKGAADIFKENAKQTATAETGSAIPKADMFKDPDVLRGLEYVFGAIGKLAKRVDVLEEKVEAVPQIGYDETHMTVLGFCKVNDITCSVYDASRAGKEAARLSREEGIEIRTVPDDRFGKVNSYHKAILSRVFAL